MLSIYLGENAFRSSQEYESHQNMMVAADKVSSLAIYGALFNLEANDRQLETARFAIQVVSLQQDPLSDLRIIGADVLTENYDRLNARTNRLRLTLSKKGFVTDPEAQFEVVDSGGANYALTFGYLFTHSRVPKPTTVK